MTHNIKIILLAFLFLVFSALPLVACAATTETAIFAGGCFWSMQHDFETLDGILQTVVGYTGGSLANPSYEQVSTGDTGHYEAIKIIYDPAKISYEQLLYFYWHDIDPTNAEGQFCDRGNEYHSAIFYNNTSQKEQALESKDQLLKSNQFNQIYTQILPANTFYPAEEYHQHYADKNPEAYAAYRTGCRRDETVKRVWGD